jgi:hypothetical protein
MHISKSGKKYYSYIIIGSLEICSLEEVQYPF